MCGIVGVLGDGAADANSDLCRVVMGMTDTLQHRGPDGTGVWCSDRVRLALGHRRLAIQDLSNDGCQPMLSASGRYVLVFNGEIYNFQELRYQLKEYPFRSRSDTEVLLAAVDKWGVEKAIPLFNGMFAFAVWDQLEGILSLARDRLGEKPLYYAWLGRDFVFGSEIRALRAHPLFGNAISRRALCSLLRYGYIPGDASIYGGVFKLRPGEMLSIQAGTGPGGEVHTSYWNLAEVAASARESSFRGTEAEAEEVLHALLVDSVRLRMNADVPVGAFLSGGIDSSCVVALMQSVSDRPVKTFTVGFPVSAYDEAPYARAVAKHLETDHTEIYVSERDLLETVPRIPVLYDEPFADSSQIPTMIICQIARRSVTVALSGDGGDELFGGYTRYRHASGIWAASRHLSAEARVRAASALVAVEGPLDWLVAAANRLAPARLRFRTPDGKASYLGELIGCADFPTMYHRLLSHFPDPGSIVLDADQNAAAPPACQAGPAHDPLRTMMFVDTVLGLPDDILVKVDRASMGVSLEMRLPILDHRIVEFTWRLPPRMVAISPRTKRLLRRVLNRYVPDGLVDRPKSGFAVPLHDWLCGPLREWAESLLNPTRLKDEGYLDWRAVRKLWTEHLENRPRNSVRLWDILTFQAWMERQHEANHAAA